MSDITAEFLYEQLQFMHPFDRGWLFLPEVRFGTGYSGDNEKRIDAWAIQCWKQKRVCNLKRAFEIKISKSDSRRELLNPDKRWTAYAISNEFYFVAPAGIFKIKDLEKQDGLIEWSEEKGLKIVKLAKQRESLFPRWSFVASIIRKFRDSEERLKNELQFYKNEIKNLKEEVK